MPKCDQCGQQQGIWEVEIRPKFHDSYGKRDGLLCDDCLMASFEGVHTGGGYNSEHILRIYRCEPRPKSCENCIKINVCKILRDFEDFYRKYQYAYGDYAQKKFYNLIAELCKHYKDKDGY
jgi:hypothetical protein